MGAPLRYHHNTTNLLHLRIIGWTHTIQEASNLKERERERERKIADILGTWHIKLRYYISTYMYTISHQYPRLRAHLGSKVRYDDKLLEYVLWQDVSETRLFDVVGGDVDVVGTKVKVRSRDRSNSPLRL